MSTENPAIITLREQIDMIREGQQPTRDQIAELQDRLTEGDQQIRRNEAAIEILQGATSLNGPRRVQSGTRRPRGAVKAAILEYVRERPGATAAQIAEAVGGSKPSITASLQKMATDGVLVKESLGGRAVGFKVA